MKMPNSRAVKKVVGILTLSSFLSMSIQAPVFAGMVTSTELSAATQTEIQRDEVRNLLARKDVRAHLEQYGVDEAQLDARINAMTDSEIQAFHAQMASLPAGEGFLGAVIAIIVIFMLLDIAGVTDIFPSI